MNHSINTANLDGNKLANDIWAMLGSSENIMATVSAPMPQTVVCSEKNLMNNAPDLATEILSKLEEKKKWQPRT